MVRNARVNTKGSLVENEGYAGEMNLLHIRGVLTAQWPLARFCAKKASPHSKHIPRPALTQWIFVGRFLAAESQALLILGATLVHLT